MSELNVEELQKKDAWILAIALYRKNQDAKRILKQIQNELNERIDKDGFDNEAWLLLSSVKATMDSINFHYKGNYFKY